MNTLFLINKIEATDYKQIEQIRIEW